LLRAGQFSDLNVWIIPGNHDPGLHSMHLAAQAVKVFHEPEIVQLHPEEPPFLFLPYKPLTSMGEAIQPFADRLPAGQWVLIGHGDFARRLRIETQYEPGVYMPLTSTDLQRYRPLRAFLGHIHQPSDHTDVHYPGSSCGLDISETGRRRFLVYDTRQDAVGQQVIDTEVIYYQERFIMLPAEDERAYIRQMAEQRVQAWNLPIELQDRVRLRVVIAGYCRDRRTVLDELRRTLAGYPFLDDAEPDASQLFVSDDEDRRFLVDRVRSRLTDLAFASQDDDPSPDQILVEALRIVYGSEA
jgi:DNA repair protein SbcD/Mre11